MLTVLRTMRGNHTMETMTRQPFAIRLFQFMYMYLAFVTATVAGFENWCTIRQQKFRAVENCALEGHAYAKRTVRSRLTCGLQCNNNERCKSFNFYNHNKVCELNLSTRREYPKDLKTTPGSFYFDFEKDTHSLAESCFNRHRSCSTLLHAGYRSSGIYTIYPEGFSDSGLGVYCDMDTDGGGWIVFQRRQNGSVDFWRSWAEYQSGFGDLAGEFWLGNDNLVTLTSDDSRGTWELRVDLGDWESNTAWAKYTDFKLTPNEYRLTYDLYDADSTAGDSLAYSKGWGFTTIDKDNDGWPYNCADYHKGAWWFNGAHVTDCMRSHLNGIYYPEGEKAGVDWGIHWLHWKGTLDYSLKKCSMKIREM